MLLTLMAFCFVLTHSVGERVPRFLVFAELGSILRHVAYAYGALLRSYSLCRGGLLWRFVYGILVGYTSLQFLLVWKACT